MQILSALRESMRVIGVVTLVAVIAWLAHGLVRIRTVAPDSGEKE
jgi:cell division protein FtsW (lipid II flippase)